MRHITEGFFGNSTHRTPERIVNVQQERDRLYDKLMQRQRITEGEWEFIDSYMNGYYHVPNNTHMYNLLDDLTTTYGNNISLNWLDISSITDLSEAIPAGFIGDVSRWDTRNVTDMTGLFYDCGKFNGDLSSWDVSNVTNMNQMFCGCYQFNGDLSSWDVSHVEDMSFMFSWCRNFDCDLSSWDVSHVENMNCIFMGCNKFSHDLSTWDVPSSTITIKAFDECPRMNNSKAPWYRYFDKNKK